MEIALDVSPGRVYLADALQFLRALPDASIDLAFYDPPYPSLEDHRARGTTTRMAPSKASSNTWFETITWETYEELFSQTYRVLKPNSHFFLWSDETAADVVKSQQAISDPRVSRLKSGRRKTKSGLYYWRDWIWVKTTLDGTKLRGGVGWHGRGANERLLFFEKGKRALNHDCLDVIPAPRPSIKDAPAPKPPEVTRQVISACTNPGDLVLDVFAGTGVVGVEALKMGRRFLLADVDHEHLLPELREYVATPTEEAA